MPRPRFVIRPDDWFDTLDWLDYQLSQPGWLVTEDHPVHQVGLAAIKDRVRQFRYVSQPSHPDCEALQALLRDSLTRPDWDRLRKTLSARRRRRRERRLNQAPVNLTLTAQAHLWLKQLMQAGGHATLSGAVEEHLPDLVATLETNIREQRFETIKQQIKTWPTDRLIIAIERYLQQAREERSLATACRIAYQWYLRDPDRTKEGLMRERFVEDLVWNESHLKWPVNDFLDRV